MLRIKTLSVTRWLLLLLFAVALSLWTACPASTSVRRAKPKGTACLKLCEGDLGGCRGKCDGAEKAACELGCVVRRDQCVRECR